MSVTEKFRYPVGARLWEFRQGSVAGGESLAPAELAAIELAEETGLRACPLDCLGFLHHGYGRSTNGFHAFYATALTPGPADRETEEQDMRSGAFTMDEIWSLVEAGTMTAAASIAALALLDRRRATDGTGPTR